MKMKRLAKAAEEAADFLKCMAHPARLRLVCVLCDGERSAGELARLAGLKPPALSQQAGILVAEGILARRRAAQSVLYRLKTPHARGLANFLHSAFCAEPRRINPANRFTN